MKGRQNRKRKKKEKESSRGGISRSEMERSRRYREVQRRPHLALGPIYRHALSFTRAHCSRTVFLIQVAVYLYIVTVLRVSPCLFLYARATETAKTVQNIRELDRMDPKPRNCLPVLQQSQRMCVNISLERCKEDFITSMCVFVKKIHVCIFISAMR